MTFIADFQLPEKRALLRYSKPSTGPIIPIEALPMIQDHHQKMVDSGAVTPQVLEKHDTVFALLTRFYDILLVPDSVMTQNVKGLAKTAKTTQDSRPLHEKTTADVIRLKPAAAATTHAENMAAFAFMADAALSFLPLSHNHMFLDDAGACASLDFALRLFRNDVDVNAWCRREAWTSVGADGRTYSEWQFWDESGQNLVANMTQQSIMRPKVVKEVKTSKI